jgi:hypothetical protein
MNLHGCSCCGGTFQLPSLLELVLRRPEIQSGIATDTVTRCSTVQAPVSSIIVPSIVSRFTFSIV